jgi:hypothetical protein
MKKLLLIFALLFSFSFADQSMTEYFNSIDRNMIVKNNVIIVTDKISKTPQQLIFNIAYTLYLFETENLKAKIVYKNFVYLSKNLRISLVLPKRWVYEWNFLDSQEQADAIIEALRETAEKIQ